MRGEDIATGEPPGYVARIVTSDDRQADDILFNDVVCRFAKRVVFEDDSCRALMRGICDGARAASKAGANEVSTGNPPVVEAPEIWLSAIR
jgi:hypothetical protein